MTMTSPIIDGAAATRPPRQPLRQLSIDTAYVLVGLPLGVVAFTLAVAGLSAGASLLVTLVGLPVLAATHHVARGLSVVERARVAPVLHRRPVQPAYRAAPQEVGWWRRIVTPLVDVQSWLDVLHSLLRFPVSVAAFTIVVTWWAGALGGLTYWFWQRWLPRSPDNHDLPELLGLGTDDGTRIWFHTLVGVIFGLTLPWVVRLCAVAEAGLAWALLSKIAEVRQQITGLTERAQTAQDQRSAAVSAEATALRRLERDIHDGPQQRLVRLAVDLGRAQRQLDADPAAARQTVDEALAQAREAIGELRTLSRGIAPPILADRGLAAAAASLAAQATVPVRLDIPDDLGRLDPLTEQTVYFVMAETLTNVAKHAHASALRVSVQIVDGRLRVAVFDDGRGGAHVAKGHGLSGLSDRVRSAGGELSVRSPDGGPTEITAELPCPTPAERESSDHDTSQF